MWVLIIAFLALLPGGAWAQSAQPVTQAALANSNVTPFSGTCSTTTCASGTFTPAAGRNFNFAVWITGTTTPGSALGCTIYLARSTDSGTTFLPLTANGTQLETLTVVASEQWSDSQVGVQYEPLVSGSCSTSVNFRFSQ